MENNNVIYSSAPLSALKHLCKAHIANPRNIDDKSQWCEVTAKWDTGATICAISRKLANKLGLSPRASLAYTSFAGEGECRLDVVAVSFGRNGLYINVLAGIVDAMPHADCDLLIGMDLISTGVLEMGAVPGRDELWLTFEPTGPEWHWLPSGIFLK